MQHFGREECPSQDQDCTYLASETVDVVYHEPPKAAPKKQYWSPKPSKAKLDKIVEEELKPKGKKPVQ